jgi:hypothetical protein
MKPTRVVTALFCLGFLIAQPKSSRGADDEPSVTVLATAPVLAGLGGCTRTQFPPNSGQYIGVCDFTDPNKLPNAIACRAVNVSLTPIVVEITLQRFDGTGRSGTGAVTLAPGASSWTQSEIFELNPYYCVFKLADAPARAVRADLEVTAGQNLNTLAVIEAR